MTKGTDNATNAKPVVTKNDLSERSKCDEKATEIKFANINTHTHTIRTNTRFSTFAGINAIEKKATKTAIKCANNIPLTYIGNGPNGT